MIMIFINCVLIWSSLFTLIVVIIDTEYRKYSIKNVHDIVMYNL